MSGWATNRPIGLYENTRGRDRVGLEEVPRLGKQGEWLLGQTGFEDIIVDHLRQADTLGSLGGPSSVYEPQGSTFS